MKNNNLIPFRRTSKLGLIAPNFDVVKLKKKGFIVIRNYGTSVEFLEADLNDLSGGKLFLSKHIGTICHEFSILPSSINLSEQMETGGFHTDFLFQETPPEYIALLCLEPDPKFPLYGINQVAHLDDFIKKMNLVFCVTIKDLLTNKLVYELPNYGRFEKPLITQIDNKTRFSFHEKLLSKEQAWRLQSSNLTIQKAINCVLMDISEDICLNKGDLLVVSNYEMLHRRGECSIKFDPISEYWHSRKMATIRFDL